MPFYSIFLLEQESEFSVDFVKYKSKKYSILFLSPYQNLKWFKSSAERLKLIQFHGDFYCIEYHKKEVACNGLLFNNIYLLPFIELNTITFEEIVGFTKKMQIESESEKRFSDSVLKSYLQLILAICSNEKDLRFNDTKIQQFDDPLILKFKGLLETYFVQERSPSFYSGQLAMTNSTFSKKIKAQFGRTPTQLIQERVVLEAKKLLHLTHKSIKEVAFELNFDDEFYFSKYFKKEVGLSPSHFREKVGISIAAK
ncbi:helix-turn-helix domain-containing protein [Aquimarina algicola]|uniref:AraC family transcriptional regulator n=1 Tax=Aquimarina algicola TaxID=2589995 RepID=A0A504IWU7_9FLAO|nr:helix-turn-helix domain-containing protein [Aquimarina algicola]TPN82856.1 AraC family transcriptional regulator [Aquimarina algicola]